MDDYETENLLRDDAMAFCTEAKERWKEIVGGGFVFILIGTAASAGFDVPKLVSGIGAFCLAVSWACFQAFRGERRKAEKVKHQYAAEEEERSKKLKSARIAHIEKVRNGLAELISRGSKLLESPRGTKDLPPFIDAGVWDADVMRIVEYHFSKLVALRLTSGKKTTDVFEIIEQRLAALKEIARDVDFSELKDAGHLVMLPSSTPDKEEPTQLPAS